MKAIYNLKQIERQYKNNGQHLEQIARYNLTGKIEKADNKPFYLSGDIGDIQIKSQRATICKGLDLEAHLKIDGANRYGYITKDGTTLYIMNREEYKAFIIEFQTIDKESNKNGGNVKIRLKSESRVMKEWLQVRT